MRNRADRLGVPQARHQSAIDPLEEAALGLDRRIGRLIEHAAHLPVASRRAVAVIHTRALFIAGTRTNPG